MHRFLFSDTETADMNPIQAEDGTTYGGICEISVRDVNSLSMDTINHYYSKLNPECPISPSAAGVHGIRDADVVNCPTMTQFVQNMDMFNPDMGTMYIIAHNVKFDRKFMEPYVGDAPMVWGDLCSTTGNGEVHWVDTLKLARMIYPEAPDHKLQTLRVYLDLPFDVSDSHSAGGDTRSLVDLVKHMMGVTGKSLLELCQWALEPQEITEMPFGKHKGKPLTEMVEREKGYLRWLLKQSDVDPDLVASIKKLM